MTGAISFASDVHVTQRLPRNAVVALGCVLALCPILLWQSDRFAINEVLRPAISLTFWLALSTTVAVQAVISTIVMQAFLPNPSRSAFWLSRLGNAMLNVAFASIESIGFKHFWGLPIGGQHDFAGIALIASVPVVLTLLAAERGIAVRRRPATAAAPALHRAGMLKRMPRGVVGPVELLRSEDHYLHVHTASGAGMIKYRLGDAVDELGPDAGMQVHKSWWVSYSAICGIERSSGRFWIVLRDGRRVPVSRTYLAEVRERWRGAEGDPPHAKGNSV